MPLPAWLQPHTAAARRSPVAAIPPVPPLHRRDWGRVDAYALATPRPATTSVARLATHLAAGARDEAETARAIYRWTAEHIRYDAARAGGRWRDGAHLAENVLHRRVGVCDGYAVLVAELARHAGLEAHVLTGTARGLGAGPPGGPTRPVPNHAWNAVRSGGAWGLLDAAWGAGYHDPVRGRYVRCFTGVYFLPPPAALIYTHFPEDPAWQLLAQPVDFAAFAALPLVKPAFFRDGLRFDGPVPGRLAVEGEAEVPLLAPGDADLLPRVLEVEGASERTLEDALATVARRGGERAVLRAAFPRPGHYRLRLFSRAPGSAAPYDWAFELAVHVRRGSRTRFARSHPEAGAVQTAVPPEGVVAPDGIARLTLPAAPGEVLHAVLEQHGRTVEAQRVLVQPVPEGWQVLAHAPRAGHYVLRVYRRKGDSGPYAWAADVPLHARRGCASRLPLAYEGFAAHGATLAAPLQERLRAGTPWRFALRLPGAEAAAVVQGHDWQPLGREGEHFAGEVRLRPGEATLYGRWPGDAQWSGLLRYRVA